MSIITWPDFRFDTMSYSIEHNVELSFMRNGKAYSAELPGSRFVCTLNFGEDYEAEGFADTQRPALEALIAKLRGGANWLSMPGLWRPVPRGTMRGTPTIGVAAAGGATTASLTGIDGTAKAGDLLGIGGQLVEILDDAAPSGGNMVINFLPELRVAQSIGAAVVWNQPTTNWIPKTPTSGPFPFGLGGQRLPFSIDLVEVW